MSGNRYGTDRAETDGLDTGVRKQDMTNHTETARTGGRVIARPSSDLAQQLLVGNGSHSHHFSGGGPTSHS